MLSAADLELMRDEAEDFLPDTAVIKTPSWVSDGGGGGTTTFTASGTISCRIMPVSGNERIEGARLNTDTEYLVTMPHDAPVNADSVLEIGGNSFSVTNIGEPRSWAITLKVEAKGVN